MEANSFVTFHSTNVQAFTKVARNTHVSALLVRLLVFNFLMAQIRWSETFLLGLFALPCPNLPVTLILINYDPIFVVCILTKTSCSHCENVHIHYGV